MPTGHDTRQFEWIVDSSNAIVSVNDNWLSFAEENDPHFADPLVVQGCPLNEFITDAETRHLYDCLMQRVRTDGKPVTVPYRCDSPDCRRFMEVDLSPAEDGGVRFLSRIVRLEPRPTVALMTPTVQHSNDLLSMCSWCKKVKLPANGYTEVEDAVDKLSLFASEVLPHLTHGCCPQCYAAMMEQIDREN